MDFNKKYNIYSYEDFHRDFFNQLKEEFPDATDKQINTLLTIAWDHGHSSGEQEIYLNEYKDILER